MILKWNNGQKKDTKHSEGRATAPYAPPPSSPIGTPLVLNGPNHSSTDCHHPMKKSVPSPKFPTSPHWDGRFLPHPFNAIWKNLACFIFQSRGVEIISTSFLV